MYGRSIEGRVDSISGATGARMSLLPPENATGNFVKVVQRIPVKIVFDRLPEGVVLRPGMNVDATIFTVSDQVRARSSGRVSEQFVQIVGRADQAQVRQRLREIAEQFALRADLFREQAEMVGVTQQLLEQQLRLLHAVRRAPSPPPARTSTR